MNDLKRKMDPQAADGQAGFEILAITSGNGNGWQFPAETLQASLALWEGVESYIDHAQQPGWNRSVRDLAGICQSPQWDADCQGIRLQLHPSGPGAELLNRLGTEWLAGSNARSDMGFSADISFTANGQVVNKIIKVHSLDLVMKPARGGRFLGRITDQGKGEGQDMDKETAGNEQIENNDTSVKAQQVLNVQNQTREQRAQMAGDQKLVHVVPESFQTQMCGMLLESTLTAARLPEAVSTRLRKQFAGRIFDLAELTLAVEDGRSWQRNWPAAGW